MICGAVQCGVTNKKFLRAADTKLCIRDITKLHVASFPEKSYCAALRG